MNTNEKKCRFHPDAAAAVFCNKLEHGYCESCLESRAVCSDPELYCRHRTYCIIWEFQREAVRERKVTAGGRPERGQATASPRHK